MNDNYPGPERRSTDRNITAMHTRMNGLGKEIGNVKLQVGELKGKQDLFLETNTEQHKAVKAELSELSENIIANRKFIDESIKDILHKVEIKNKGYRGLVIIGSIVYTALVSMFTGDYEEVKAFIKEFFNLFKS